MAASPTSAGKTYAEAVAGRWSQSKEIPANIRALKVKSVEADLVQISSTCRIAFSALDMDKGRIKDIEEAYAAQDVAVVSNNSAHRWTEDVPMFIPEVNPQHVSLIDLQRKNRAWSKGLIAVKPNCSIQSYVPVLHALRQFGLERVSLTTMQAISGAGKTFSEWPEMIDNIIPLIPGEEEKSEKEPLKIWGSVTTHGLSLASLPIISATCIRVPVTDGHMASVSVKFTNCPSKKQLEDALDSFDSPIAALKLPSAPKKFLKLFSEPDRPQSKLDRELDSGMCISVGRIREDTVLDWKFVALSHNTLRGAAGGAVLMAELLKTKGYI